MATVASTSVQGIPPGYNNDNIEKFQAVVPVAAAADSITMQLPARWVGKGAFVRNVFLEQFTTATEGTRTHSSLPVTSWSYVETTGILTVVIGATAVTLNGRLSIEIAPGNLAGVH